MTRASAAEDRQRDIATPNNPTRSAQESAGGSGGLTDSSSGGEQSVPDTGSEFSAFASEVLPDVPVGPNGPDQPGLRDIASSDAGSEFPAAPSDEGLTALPRDPTVLISLASATPHRTPIRSTARFPTRGPATPRSDSADGVGTDGSPWPSPSTSCGCRQATAGCLRRGSGRAGRRRSPRDAGPRAGGRRRTA